MSRTALNSETTQNVALGGLSGAGGIAGLLLTVRQVLPDVLPWSVDADAGIVALVSTVAVPLLSRLIAFRRKPGKRAWRRGR